MTDLLFAARAALSPAYRAWLRTVAGRLRFGAATPLRRPPPAAPRGADRGRQARGCRDDRAVGRAATKPSATKSTLRIPTVWRHFNQ